MTLLAPITDTMVDEVHSKLWAEAIDTHGDKYKVPGDIAQNISNITRGMYVLQSWDGRGSAITRLNGYSVDEAIMIHLINTYCDDDIVEDEPLVVTYESREKKYEKMALYAHANVFEQFTTEHLVEVGGFSYQTTLKYLQESLDYRKVKKGLWECRDDKAERDAAKN